MLVLGRNTGQSILIGKDIVITILKKHGSQTRVGIKAPHNIIILRDELKPHAKPKFYPKAALIP
jgi:carbon storage regulator